LDWRELLLHFYQESKDYTKDITEIKETAGDMKDIRNIINYASSSPLLCTREVKE
jgi:hypothetical protein